MQRRGRRRGPRREYGPREDYAYVLDYMPQGNPLDPHPVHRKGPVVQLVGERFFTLMDASVLPGVELAQGDRIYIGPNPEERLVQRPFRIRYEDLTSVARSALPDILEKIVREKEDVFVEFFNIAGPISIRFHSLELLPGIGKKALMKLLDHREKAPFKSFDEIRSIIHVDPAKSIAERIIEELKGGQKYYLFVPPPEEEARQPPGQRPVFLDYLGRIYKSRRGRRAGEEGGGGEAQA